MTLTFIGQLIGFGIFVFICYRFVWPRIDRVIVARQEKIHKDLEEAANDRKEAKHTHDEAEKVLKDAGMRAQDIISDARKQAKNILDAATSDAKNESLRYRDEARKSIESERRALKVELQNETEKMLEGLLRKTLEGAPTQEMQQKWIAQRVQELSKDSASSDNPNDNPALK